MLKTYCSLCENNKVFATGKCKSCYNKSYWANADETKLQKRRDAVRKANEVMKAEGYVPKAGRPKISKEEKTKRSVIINRRRRLKRQAILDDIKIKSGCVDCGYREQAVALDFDHVRGEKIMGIAQALGQLKPMEFIMEEVTKCDVRCANCHRVITEKRKNGKLFF